MICGNGWLLVNGLGLRWQGGSRDTAFGRAENPPDWQNVSSVRKRRGAVLPAAVQYADFNPAIPCRFPAATE